MKPSFTIATGLETGVLNRPRQFAAHVIADSVTERNRWLKAILERAQLEGEIVLSDGSPMFLKKLEVRHGADPLREGQLILIGLYGVLAQHRKESAQIRLLHPDYKIAEEEESHGTIDLQNLTPGEIIKRSWSFRVNKIIQRMNNIIVKSSPFHAVS